MTPFSLYLPLPLHRGDSMGSFLPDSGSYELLTVIGRSSSRFQKAPEVTSFRGPLALKTPPSPSSFSSPTGRGLDDLMTVNLARYRPSGEHVAIRRIDLESCTNDMVAYLQVGDLRPHPVQSD